jgi:Protein of unknown function (DUF721).
MRNTSEQPIAAIINQLIDEYRLRDKLLQVSIPHIWQKIMGAAVARRTLDISFHKKVLTIRMSSAPLKNDLLYERDNIRQRINEELGGDYVQE